MALMALAGGYSTKSTSFAGTLYSLEMSSALITPDARTFSNVSLSGKATSNVRRNGLAFLLRHVTAMSLILAMFHVSEAHSSSMIGESIYVWTEALRQAQGERGNMLILAPLARSW